MRRRCGALFSPLRGCRARRALPAARFEPNKCPPQCITGSNDRLNPEPETVNTIPGTLTFENVHHQNEISSEKRFWQNYRGGSNGNQNEPLDSTVPAYGWKSWIVSCKQSANYKFSVIGEGGPAEFIVDDAVIAKGAGVGKLQGSLRLTPGVHSIKVKSSDKPVKVIKIIVE